MSGNSGRKNWHNKVLSDGGMPASRNSGIGGDWVSDVVGRTGTVMECLKVEYQPEAIAGERALGNKPMSEGDGATNSHEFMSSVFSSVNL